jgi:hypothetical protein
MVDIGRKFASYAPDFTGPAPAETAAEIVLKLAHAASLENGDGGSAVSYFWKREMDVEFRLSSGLHRVLED